MPTTARLDDPLVAYVGPADHPDYLGIDDQGRHVVAGRDGVGFAVPVPATCVVVVSDGPRP